MPYHQYRQTPMQNSMARRDMWDNKSLAMAYVPWQMWRNIYDADKALDRGTIFQELDKPFVGKRGIRR